MPEVPSFLRRVLTHAGLSLLCFAVVAVLAMTARHARAHAPLALRAQLTAAIDDGGEDVAPSSKDSTSDARDRAAPAPVFADDPVTDNTGSSSAPSFGSAGSWLGYARGFAPSQGLGSSPSSSSTPAPKLRVVNDPAPSDHHASGDASWYSTSPGACAHRTLPTGTVVTVTNAKNGKSTTCKVEGWGPSDTSRAIDLSQESFTAIANPDDGVVPVTYTW
jgi:rare lipoprotein A